MMRWIYLFVAGLMEVGWIYSLKFSGGFRKIIPMIFYAVFGLLNTYFFSLALEKIPVAIAYAAWMGIAMIGITASEIYIFKEPYTLYKLLFLLLILIGIGGLKYLSNE